jgi:integrase/recombinase XerC/integrase/recombinase XerD
MATELTRQLESKLADQDLAPGSVERILLDVAQFEEHFRGSNGEPLDPANPALTSLDLAEWRQHLQLRGAKPATLHRKFASLRKAMSLLAPERMLQLRWPKLPRITNPSPSAFTRPEFRALLRGAEQLSVRDAAIINLAVWTGARASTLAAAKLSKVTLQPRSGLIEYDVAKGGHPYRVPLNAEARAALARWIAERPQVDHDFLFTSERWPHQPIGAWTIHHTWHRRLAKHVPASLAAQLHGSHQARHNLARTLLEDGTPLPDIAAILNHKSVATTANIYCRPSQHDLEKALERLVGEEA